MQEYHCGEKMLRLWRLYLLAIAIVAAFLCGFVCFFSRLIGAILGLLFLAAGLFLYAYLSRYRASLRYTIQGNRLEIQRGVYFQKHNCLTAAQILYIKRLSTPLQRRYGLCTLQIYGGGARARLPGLSQDGAAALLSALETSGGEEPTG